MAEVSDRILGETTASPENKWVRRAKLAFFSAPRFALVKWFGIGPFHITPTRYKQYCVDLIEYLNSKPNRGAILDIGCGIGDVLLAADFEMRTGLDHKQGVLDALQFRARLLPGRAKSLTTGLYKLGEGQIEGRFDFIVLCNWIHNIDPETLRQNFTTMFNQNLNSGGELIFDTVSGGHYPHHHDPGFLAERINAEISVIGTYDGGHIKDGGSRRLVSFQKPAT